jgi:metal-responsive CopG/Arc/MetJ family transcriptional regulator
MPDDLIAEVDRLVGQRERSRLVTEAVRAKLASEQLKQVAAELGGALADVPIPNWETSESAAEWVHSLRRSGDRHDWPQPIGEEEH